ncbi:MAG: glycoside hydrolase family 43 protein [Muribaculum sp.]|nr:glycoside hydrolase family 43 protein [Muribaculum sp.]
MTTTRTKAFIAMILGCAAVSQAQRPIIQTKYTADPAPMVYNDTIFLYTTHDEDDADGFKMLDWLLYTSTDMVNWTDCGSVASLKDFKWHSRDNGAWAEQVVERDGKFYMYCPIHGNGIGVLVADSPYGPFVDPIGKPLVWQKEHWNDIDPTVFVDDDGQAYMYWGNPELYCVKLNDDMVSYSGEIVKFPRITDYQEGPWFYKRGGKYYLAFASTCCPEGIGYAMSDGPMGPWEYKGHIMDHTPKTRGNHPGIIDYKGKSYVFGLNYDILRLSTPDHHERRSVSAAEMTYNPDGTIVELPYFSENVVTQIEPFNPFRRVEAETMAWGYGLKTSPFAGGIYLHDIDNGEHLLVKGVDFGKNGAKSIEIAAACVKPGVEVEVRAGDKVIGTVKISNTGNLDTYQLHSASLQRVKGVHDLYLYFKGEGKDLFRMDYWKMNR